MIDLPSWFAIALAWCSAWVVDHRAPSFRGECLCNCSCETVITQHPCPEGSWSWELIKIIFALCLGLLLGTINLAAIAATAFVKGIRLSLARLRAWASTTSPSLASAPPAALEGGTEHRELARRQLEVVRQRRSART